MATFRIKRFNPEKQPEPYYEEFQLDIPPAGTLHIAQRFQRDGIVVIYKVFGLTLTSQQGVAV